MGVGQLTSFVGRQRELEELVAALSDADAGRGQLFLVTGEPGIGKTRLARELERVATARGATVAWGRCWEGGGAPAYWPWTQIFRTALEGVDLADVRTKLGPHAGALLALLPELDLASSQDGAGSDDAASRFRICDAAARFLRLQSRSAPLVLILDDLHAADAASLVLLQFVARELSGTAMVVIGTYREVEARWQPTVAAALAEAGREGTKIPLLGLSRDHLADYIERTTARRVPDATIDAIHRVTEGNPFFVDEIVRTLASTGNVEASPDDLAIPENARAAVRRRLESLSEPCRSMLSTGAVIGREFDVDMLANVLGSPADDVNTLLDEADRGGAVVASGLEHYGFRHALFRETLYDDLPPGRRLILHRRVGEAIESIHADDLDTHAAALAHHFFHVAPGGGADKAVMYARAAGRRALTVAAYEEAAVQFERALSALGLMRADDEAQCDLLLDLGNAYWQSGDRQRADDVIRHAVEVARRLGDPRRLASAGLDAFNRMAAGVPDDWQIAVFEEAVAGLAGEDDAMVALAMADMANSLYWSDDDERREHLADEAVAMARRIGHPRLLAYTLVRRNRSTFGPDSCERRLVDAAEVVSLAHQVDDGWTPPAGRIAPAWLLLMAHVGRAVASLEIGDPVGLDVELAAAARNAEKHGMPRFHWWIALLRAMRASLDGRFDESERLAADAVEIGEPTGDPDVATNFGVQIAAIRYHQNRLGEFEDLIRQTILASPTLVVWRCVLALIYAQSGRRSDAEHELMRIFTSDLNDLRKDVNWLPALVFLGEACATLRDVKRAARVYELLAPYEHRFVAVAYGSAFMGPVAHVLGLLAAAVGRPVDAEGRFRSAIAASTRLGARAFVAHARCALGELLLRDAEHRDEALAELHVALSMYRSTGLDTRADHVASMIGAARAPTDGRARPGTHQAAFRLEGDYWTITLDGATSRLKDGKGPRLIAFLLGRPSQELHALDLVAVAEGPRHGAANTNPALEDDLHVAVNGDAGDILDARARETYRRRVEDLREEISEAESWNDSERAVRAQTELDAITKELAAAVGLGGRSRRAASDVERARINVTRAISRTVKKLAAEHRSLAMYFDTTIRTGIYCSYTPDPRFSVDWKL